ncbi:MAG: hypothetical protein HWE23_04635 [Rhodobacteraceae bacterium]|nr:hypothetical protein [Paracoccaceae bacterium]
MARYINILFIFMVVVGAAAVYDVKLAAEKSASQVADLTRQIEEERAEIRHLKAEWSMLNQPERLQRLVTRYNEYLQLEELDAHKIVSPDQLPVRPVMLEPIGGPTTLGGYAGATTTAVQ